MSRKGNKQITFDNSVEITVAGQKVTVKGKKGELSLEMKADFSIEKTDTTIKVINNNKDKDAKAHHGLYRSLISNYIEGVTNGYVTEIEMTGVGYKVQKKGSNLEFALGFSHPVTVDSVEGIEYETNGPTSVSIKGIDKEKVGLVASNIIKLRDARKDPYKAKGLKIKLANTAP